MGIEAECDGLLAVRGVEEEEWEEVVRDLCGDGEEVRGLGGVLRLDEQCRWKERDCLEGPYEDWWEG